MRRIANEGEVTKCSRTVDERRASAAVEGRRLAIRQGYKLVDTVPGHTSTRAILTFSKAD